MAKIPDKITDFIGVVTHNLATPKRGMIAKIARWLEKRFQRRWLFDLGYDYPEYLIHPYDAVHSRGVYGRPISETLLTLFAKYDDVIAGETISKGDAVYVDGDKAYRVGTVIDNDTIRIGGHDAES